MTIATALGNAFFAQCFAEGTLVKTEEGDKKIEEIEVGDKVLAYDEETGKQEYKQVTRLFRNVSSIKTTLQIRAEDGTVDEIISTPGHKYYLPDNMVNRRPNEVLEHASYNGLGIKWVSACDLKVGDRVLLSNGKYGKVITIQTEACESWITYNFEVEGFHTYYVGENGVMVHNLCDMKYSDLPDDAKTAHDAYSKNGWRGNIKGQTTNAGGKWGNIYQQLPTQDNLGKALTYREFDIGMKMPRGPSRFVVSNQMNIYYTPDHYKTFFRIIGG